MVLHSQGVHRPLWTHGKRVWEAWWVLQFPEKLETSWKHVRIHWEPMYIFRPVWSPFDGGTWLCCLLKPRIWSCCHIICASGSWPSTCWCQQHALFLYTLLMCALKWLIIEYVLQTGAASHGTSSLTVASTVYKLFFIFFLLYFSQNLDLKCILYVHEIRNICELNYQYRRNLSGGLKPSRQLVAWQQGSWNM